MATNYMRDRVNHNQILMPWLPSETISTGDAAAMMQCSKEVVRDLLEEGKIDGYRIRPHVPHSPWRVKRESVEEYIASVRREYALKPMGANSAGAAAGAATALPRARDAK